MLLLLDGERDRERDRDGERSSLSGLLDRFLPLSAS